MGIIYTANLFAYILTLLIIHEYIGLDLANFRLSFLYSVSTIFRLELIEPSVFIFWTRERRVGRVRKREENMAQT